MTITHFGGRFQALAVTDCSANYVLRFPLTAIGRSRLTGPGRRVWLFAA